MHRNFFLLPLALVAFPLFAQNHADCATALEICNKQTLHLGAAGAGNDPTEMNDATCYANGAPGNYESNSAWIRFTAQQGGSLWFIIRPDNPADDIDFVVYRLSAGACTGKTLVRCMAAGDFVTTSPCMGPTGLLPGQTDVSEDAGCTDPDDDNFLAPLDILTGETYVLAINDFSSVNDSFTVEFCGTALLGCETEVCTTLGASELPTISTVKIFPNPVSGGEARIEIDLPAPEQVSGTLFNAYGTALRTMVWNLPAGKQVQSIDTSGLPSGVYFLTLAGRQTTGTLILRVLK